ncbi:MAG: PRC-barrel domain-containing protein [Deltaproteobacteria bacterium]
MTKFLMTTAIIAGSFGAATAQDAVNLFRTAPDALELHASDFIGMRVYREEGDMAAEGYSGVQQNWDDIGEINDVIFNRDGQIEAVLVDVGGFLGMGESQVALEMKNIRFVTDDATDDANDFFLVLNAPRSAFETAPVYEMSGDMDATMPADTAPATDQAATDGTVVVDPTVEQPATDMAAGTTEAPATDVANTNTTEQPATDMAATTTAREGWTPVMAADLTSEELTGATVYGPGDETIGEVSNIILTADGKVEGAVVDVGGFLGMGEKPVELDLSQVEIVRETDGSDLRVYVSMTKDEVKAMPEYEG